MKTLALKRNEPRLLLFQHSSRDGLLVLLAAGQGALLVVAPLAPVIAIGLWWNSQTVSHYFLHKPFFRNRALNVAFSFYLSLLLGVPQSLWRNRHLAHHAGVPARFRFTRTLALESAIILALWVFLLTIDPALFLLSYLPGYLGGLVLCHVHGRYEHAGNGSRASQVTVSQVTVSHRGRLYNWLFFNDGYHVEHHAAPGAHWTELPSREIAGAPTSRWPAVLRWVETPILQPILEWLEGLVLRSRALETFVLSVHERAMRRLLRGVDGVERPEARVGIVGGGLFPRTALILRRLLPEARLTVIDLNASHLDVARERLDDGVELLCSTYDPDGTDRTDDAAAREPFDILVLPLSYRGEFERIYERPPAPVVVVHDWIWRRRGRSRIVSVLLLKRLNLLEGQR